MGYRRRRDERPLRAHSRRHRGPQGLVVRRCADAAYAPADERQAFLADRSIMTPSAETAGGRRTIRRWSRETIIEKILAWNDRYGEPPCSADWNPSLARWRAQDWRAERYREGVWPSTNAAKRPFGGSFDAAIRAAGLEPHKPGPRRRAAGLARPDVEQRAPLAPRSVDDELLAAADRVREAEARAASLERAARAARAAGGAGRGRGRRGTPACAPGERARGPRPAGARPRAGLRARGPGAGRGARRGARRRWRRAGACGRGPGRRGGSRRDRGARRRAACRGARGGRRGACRRRGADGPRGARRAVGARRAGRPGRGRPGRRARGRGTCAGRRAAGAGARGARLRRAAAALAGPSSTRSARAVRPGRRSSRAR